MKAWLAAICVCAGCATEAASPVHEEPAHVENPIPESEIGVVRFTAQAIARLGIKTALVEQRAMPAVRLVGGEVSVPPGQTTSVAAPVGGQVRAFDGGALPVPGVAVRRGDVLLRLVPFAPVDRDVRARAAREVTTAQAQFEAADARAQRVQQLLAERAGSDRMLQEANVASAVARADLDAAEARARTTRDTPLLSDVSMTVRAPSDGVVRAVSVAPGQPVAAGAPLFEIVAVESLMVRVPIYAGDLARVDGAGSARVRSLRANDVGVEARPVMGPPTADPMAATVDRWYALAADSGLEPGEAVLVEVWLRDEEDTRVLPWASIVIDAQGGSWVYACEGADAFRRVRIDPIRRAGDFAVFARGPEAGACIASVGVAEIFGSEFEPGH